MKLALSIFLILFSINYGFSQSQNDPDSTYNKFRVNLIAISVSDIDSSISWYKDHLEFLLISRNDFPEYKISVAVVERNNFQIEIVHYAASKAPSEFIKDFEKNPAIMQGIGKISFMVENIDELASRLESENVKFVRKLNHEEVLHLKSFIILDNSGNWLQFSQKDR
jgi:catechol 2,3-dioxygenase-like lactoylglutathione lyase family enzyme